MSDFGCSLVFGRPFSEGFQRWARENLCSPGVVWNDASSLHATVVNCTRPKARSLPTAGAVLGQMASLSDLLMERLAVMVQDALPLELAFGNPLSTSGLVILGSFPQSGIAALITALQGGERWIGEDRVEAVLASGRAIGVNKFAMQRRHATDTVSVTLGRSLHPETAELSSSAPLMEKICGLRIAYYRDRHLQDAVLSEELQFGKSEMLLRATIRKFFATIG